MVRAFRWLPLTLALTVGLASAAMARTPQGTPEQGRVSGKAAMTSTVLPGGISFKGQLDHAYSEAMNAHEAMVMGMKDMAANHLSNVDLVLANLDKQDPKLSAGVKSRLAAIRQDASNLKGQLGDRQAALKGTEALVGRFAVFYDQIAMAPMGGGGGPTAAAMKTPIELVAGAAASAANAQAAAASKDWNAATMHVRDAQQHLQNAQRVASSEGMKLSTTQTLELRTLNQEAIRVASLIDQRSNQAVKQAGQLVTAIGAFMPRIATSAQGGGAGTGQPSQGREPEE